MTSPSRPADVKTETSSPSRFIAADLAGFDLGGIGGDERSMNRQPSSSVYADFGLSQGDARGLGARLRRREWANYRRRFIPLENSLVSLAGNIGSVDEVRGLMDQANQRQTGILDRQRARYGLALTSAQAKESARLNALNQSRALGSATAIAARTDEDRRNALMTGMSGRPSVQETLRQ